MPRDVTGLLIDWNDGDQQALAELMPMVYDELHRLARGYMRRERSDHTLQPTALVNEAYLHLIDQSRVRWRNRAHFFGVAARMMRRVTLLHVRHNQAVKRGGGALKVTFDEALRLPEQQGEDLVALDEALDALGDMDERLLRVVELRFFAGLTIEESGEVLGVSPRTVKREWRTARAWLLDRLGSSGRD